MAKAHQPLSRAPSQSNQGVERAAKNIIALINHRPRSPTEGEVVRAIERGLASPASECDGAPDLGQQIRSVILSVVAEEARLNTLPEDGAKYQACEAGIDARHEQLSSLTAQLPSTPRTFADLLIIAEVAYYWWEKELDGTLCAIDPEYPCPNEHWAARLILAVSSMGGANMLERA